MTADAERVAARRVSGGFPAAFVLLLQTEGCVF